MAFETFNEFNKTGLDQLFVYSAKIVPSFIPLMLFSLFIITFFATFFTKQRLTGRGDAPSSFAASSFLITIIAVLMMLVDNLISTQTVVICFAVSLISVIWLYIARD